MNCDHNSWWASLKHGGMLIAPSRLHQFFPDALEPLKPWIEERLRRDITRLEPGVTETETTLIDTVLKKVCGFDDSRWISGADVPTSYSHRALTGEIIKPRKVWEGPVGEILPVFVDKEKRIGIGRGRKMVSRVIEWLRNSRNQVALLTNAQQFRLIHAGLDYDAFVEWDTDLWFEEGVPSPQVDALRILISPRSFLKVGKDPSPLLAAISESRKGEAELSSVLGENIRETVELMVRAHGPVLNILPDGVDNRDLYIAATRIIMRLVVILFAEARGLLPRDNPIYHDSYGIQGLIEQLERSEGKRLRDKYSAWPRVLALYRLIFEGSHHEKLPVNKYGGGLFQPGDLNSPDPIRKALHVFEHGCFNPAFNIMDNATVLDILRKITRAKVHVRQGRSTSTVTTPIDFSNLSSEYIGILYEGLLDFELRRANVDDPVIFLNLGDQPALPLKRLEDMDDKALATLVEKFKVSGGSKLASGDEESDDDNQEDETAECEASEIDDAADEPESIETTEPDEESVIDDKRQAEFDRAIKWGKRAVCAGKFVRPPGKNAKQHKLDEYDEQCTIFAKQIINRVFLGGEWYLVRWGGTRKGSGTFYTRPQLAVPTVQRTLRPLCYNPPLDMEGIPNPDAPASDWTPKTPDEILSLKVCDPAMGSGSFLVAALRFLTDALFESLYQHGIIKAFDDGILDVHLSDNPALLKLIMDVLPGKSSDEKFDDKLRARLKRVVVERCIYGVDIDPLAVELGRLALWVDTMDRDLPFEFLDHKLKCGNSLVGCWFDRFEDYPALAWDREGGDKSHSTGVHFKKEDWTKAIKKYTTDVIKPDLKYWLTDTRRKQIPLLTIDGKRPDAIHDEVAGALESVKSIPVQDQDERQEEYEKRITKNKSYTELKEKFDTWCALWFWPVDGLDDVPMPSSFLDSRDKTRTIVEELTRKHRFFHWELEFPDVFVSRDSGFDAIIGNPPWEIMKPNSKEFFSNIDPLYRTYGKQEALRQQKVYFEINPQTEREWLEYCAGFKSMSNLLKGSAFPFGDPSDDGGRFSISRGTENTNLHSEWRDLRSGHWGYADREHPFQHQGSADINSYKMFLELGHALLRNDGRIGLIVPSGIYTDKGTTDLRKLFLNKCRWEWLFGFENRDGIFDIHRSFKFCPVIVMKGGVTDTIRTAFMRRDLADWANAEEHDIPYYRESVERFSPKSSALLEIRDSRDLEILEKIYSNSVLLGDDGPDGWGIQYAREFDMTNDSHLFPPREKWEAKGYKPDQYGRWIGPEGDVALPLYQGAMIHQFDFSFSQYASGAGNRIAWVNIPWSEKRILPQFLMGEYEARIKHPWIGEIRVVFRDTARTTDKRTLISAVVPGFPCSNKTPLFNVDSVFHDGPPLAALLNSFLLDHSLRLRLGSIALNYFVVENLPLPVNDKAINHLLLPAMRLSMSHISYAPAWIITNAKLLPWKRLWAITPHERLRLRSMLDAIVAELYGLDWDDFAYILRDCDHPVEKSRDKSFTRALDPKGFWRVDKEKPPEQRHTVLSLIAFHDLKALIASHAGDRDAAIEEFCTQNDGDGWMLPETVRLSDYNLGHPDEPGDRSREHVPVRSVMGPRFLDWQLSQTVEESWAECEMHARNILGEEGFERLMAEIRGEKVEDDTPKPASVAGKKKSQSGQGGLFG